MTKLNHAKDMGEVLAAIREENETSSGTGSAYDALLSDAQKVAAEAKAVLERQWANAREIHWEECPKTQYWGQWVSQEKLQEQVHGQSVAADRRRALEEQFKAGPGASRIASVCITPTSGPEYGAIAHYGRDDFFGGPGAVAKWASMSNDQLVAEVEAASAAIAAQVDSESGAIRRYGLDDEVLTIEYPHPPFFGLPRPDGTVHMHRRMVDGQPQTTLACSDGRSQLLDRHGPWQHARDTLTRWAIVDYMGKKPRVARDEAWMAVLRGGDPSCMTFGVYRMTSQSAGATRCEVTLRDDGSALMVLDQAWADMIGPAGSPPEPDVPVKPRLDHLLVPQDHGLIQEVEATTSPRAEPTRVPHRVFRDGATHIEMRPLCQHDGPLDAASVGDRHVVRCCSCGETIAVMDGCGEMRTYKWLEEGTRSIASKAHATPGEMIAAMIASTRALLPEIRGEDLRRARRRC